MRCSRVTYWILAALLGGATMLWGAGAARCCPAIESEPDPPDSVNSSKYGFPFGDVSQGEGQYCVEQEALRDEPWSSRGPAEHDELSGAADRSYEEALESYQSRYGMCDGSDFAHDGGCDGDYRQDDGYDAFDNHDYSCDYGDYRAEEIAEVKQVEDDRHRWEGYASTREHGEPGEPYGRWFDYQYDYQYDYEYDYGYDYGYDSDYGYAAGYGRHDGDAHATEPQADSPADSPADQPAADRQEEHGYGYSEYEYGYDYDYDADYEYRSAAPQEQYGADVARDATDSSAEVQWEDDSPEPYWQDEDEYGYEHGYEYHYEYRREEPSTTKYDESSYEPEYPMYPVEDDVYESLPDEYETQPGMDDAEAHADPDYDPYAYGYSKYPYEQDAYYGRGSYSYDASDDAREYRSSEDDYYADYEEHYAKHRYYDEYDAGGDRTEWSSDFAGEFSGDSWTDGLADYSGIDLSAWLPGELLNDDDAALLRRLSLLFEEPIEIRHAAWSDYLTDLGPEAIELAVRFEAATGQPVLDLVDDLTAAGGLLGVFRMVERGETGVDSAAGLLGRSVGNFSEAWVRGISEMTVEPAPQASGSDGQFARDSGVWSRVIGSLARDWSLTNLGAALRGIPRQLTDAALSGLPASDAAGRAAAQPSLHPAGGTF